MLDRPKEANGWLHDENVMTYAVGSLMHERNKEKQWQVSEIFLKKRLGYGLHLGVVIVLFC